LTFFFKESLRASVFFLRRLNICFKNFSFFYLIETVHLMSCYALKNLSSKSVTFIYCLFLITNKIYLNWLSLTQLITNFQNYINYNFGTGKKYNKILLKRIRLIKLRFNYSNDINFSSCMSIWYHYWKIVNYVSIFENYLNYVFLKKMINSIKKIIYLWERNLIKR